MLARLVVCSLAVGVSLAQDAARMDQIVQSYVNDHQFMGTALVARGEQIIFNRAYGFANLEWNIANTPDSRFRLGSVTKQFTAASILLLEERGKLQVNDAVKKYMPDAPAAWDKITIFHLLTHTSGIPDFTSFPEYEKFSLFANTPAELVARFRDKPLEFEPGSRWSYSNSGFVLLGYLIERVSGESYEKFVSENIFGPLDSNTAIIMHRASGYSPGKSGMENAGYVHMTVPHGAGALYSTTGDLLKWQLGLYGGKLLKPASLEKMTTPFKNNYAFGVGVATVGGHKKFSHGGGIQGFNTELEYYPEDKLTVVVLANLNGMAPGQIARNLASLAHGEAVKLPSERKEITVDPKVLSRLVGAYQLGPQVMLVTLDGQQLSSKLGNQPTFPIFAESETMFFLKAVDAQIEFPKDDGTGRASQLILHQDGENSTGKRLSDADEKKAMDAAAEDAKRFKDQTAAPGGEAALRKMIEGLRAGKPDYDALSENLASVTARQLPSLQAMIGDLGTLQSVTFKGVGPAGPDIYEVKFEKGSLEYRIWMAADGKVDRANVRPGQ